MKQVILELRESIIGDTLLSGENSYMLDPL